MIELFINLIEIIILFIIVKGLSYRTFKPIVLDIVFFILLTITVIVPFQNYYLFWSLYLLEWFVYIFIINKYKIYHSLLQFSITFLLFYLSQMFIISLFNMLFVSDYFIALLSEISSLFIVAFAIIWLKKLKIYSIVLQSHLILRMSIVVISFFVIYFVQFSDYLLYISELYILIVSFFVVVLLSVFLYYERKIFFHKMELNSYEKNYPIYESLITDIRASQHEFNNRLQSLQSLVFTSRDDDLKNKMSSYIKDYSTPSKGYELLELNTPLLAATLYSFIKKCEDRGVNVDIIVRNYFLELETPEYVITDLVNILVSNALDESLKGDNICISIDEYNNHFIFSVKNRVDDNLRYEDVSKFFKPKYSNKEKHLGLGLRALERDINDYKGNLTVEISDSNNKRWIEFTLDI